MKIKNIYKIQRNNEPVYNLEVKDNHNYIANGILVSNCHKLRKANKICNIIDDIKTNNKFGLTGTLPDQRIDELNIISKIGPVIFEKSSYELRQEKFLSNVNVNALHVKYLTNPPDVPGMNKYRSELMFIYNNTYRNNIINTVCKNTNNNTLILVNHIVHGEILYNILSKLPGKVVHFIRGEVNVDDRDKAIQQMEKQNNIVCIAISAIFSTGINVKNLHLIVLASGGKSFIRTIQTIGRGLRLHQSKGLLIIVDIADELKYGQGHSESRKLIYDKEKIPYSITNIVEK